MNGQAFPIDHYMEVVVRCLDTIKYQDNSYDRHERVKNLKFTYSEASKHFTQLLQQNTMKSCPKKLDAGLRTITRLVVCGWTKVSPQAMVALTIYWTYILILDDSLLLDVSSNGPSPEMLSFSEDLVHGRQQKHPWWRLMNGHLPQLLSHYGGFCAFNIIRGTFDFFQGCWIEQFNFQGFPGSHDFPLFLRRLNGLGQVVGGTLFPAEQFDEKALFAEITTAIAQLEPLPIFVNDVMSFYKEFDDIQNETSIVLNYCQVEGISLEQALDRVARDTIHGCEQLAAVFEGKNPKVVATLEAFVQGYFTWHFCDHRYRMNEVYERSGDSPVGIKFRHYYEEARRVGDIDPSEWAVSPLSAMAE